VLVALLGASGFMLLIALSSVAGALLAKTAGRRGELAVRAALGASRARLLRQLLTESTVLAAIAALAGAALAWLLLEAAADSIGGYLGAPVPGGAGRITPGAGLLAAAVAASVAVAFAFALLPAVSSTRLEDRTTLLRAAGREASGSAGAGWLRRTLIAAQIALTMVLLVGAGLMARTVIALAAEPLGFRAEGVVKGEMLLPLSVYRDSSARVVGVRRILTSVVATPGVRSAAVASPYPFRPAGPTEVTAEGRPASDPTTPRAMSYTVSPGYFAVMEIPIVAGRGFVERDDARGLPVAIVSQELARRLWPGGSPIGKRLRIGDGEPDESEWRTVVGVARETREPASGQQHPDVYVLYAQQPRPYLSVLARTAGDPRALGPELQRAVGRVDDVLALAEVEPLADIVGRTGTRPRVLAVLLTSFALFSLGLAALALYSSLSYLVAQRTRELAVRVAVGADARAIRRLVLGEGAPTIGAGVVAGLALSLALGRLLASQLYGVTATDLPTFAAITGLVALAALAAVAGPARRATRVDPAVVLRGE
jgi:putative ABC transport system permease protein